jgi:hypothetical protein
MIFVGFVVPTEIAVALTAFGVVPPIGPGDVRSGIVGVFFRSV